MNRCGKDKSSQNQLGALGGLLALGVTVVAAKSIVDTTQELATGKKAKKSKGLKGTDVTSRALNKMLGKY